MEHPVKETHEPFKDKSLYDLGAVAIARYGLRLQLCRSLVFFYGRIMQSSDSAGFPKEKEIEGKNM